MLSKHSTTSMEEQKCHGSTFVDPWLSEEDIPEEEENESILEQHENSTFPFFDFRNLEAMKTYYDEELAFWQSSSYGISIEREEKIENLLLTFEEIRKSKNTWAERKKQIENMPSTSKQSIMMIEAKSYNRNSIKPFITFHNLLYSFISLQMGK